MREIIIRPDGEDQVQLEDHTLVVENLTPYPVKITARQDTQDVWVIVEEVPGGGW